ncbi:4'-phosphopantetheinyl transferase family protein [Xanthocytophaga agilis]|uniref:4'-phosphopantetheinyl transferase superfamily protein n=1 Tax=Xanthocytophaga agilis TaxID=3048010 RepID=A0AAE3UDP8_9BACT|nr:4'-phosphopantetheinyl transferase superfamily protein [Xanthocytophaga agilis]MDJ1500566.1 4'-phosphopantetheinyl transferase superfamily protein [Xanthocytophaga agilis]
MITILYADCSSSYVSEEAYFYWLPYLSDTMQKQVLSYKIKRDAYLSLAGKVLLYKALQKEDSSHAKLSEITYTDFRRPFVPDLDMDFNIAHSEDFAIIAYTRYGKVGIDLERMIAVRPEDFKSQMSMDEWMRIENAVDQQTAFYVYWTQKEAVLKANGKGMYIPLQSFQIQTDFTYLEGDNWFLKEIQIADGYKCHLAMNQEQSVEIYNLTREIWNID